MRAFRQQSQAATPEADLLPPDRARRKFDRSPVRPSGADVIDAQFIVVRDVRTSAPRPVISESISPVGDLQARLRAAFVTVETRLQRLSEVSFALVVALAFVAIFSLAGHLAFGGSGHPDLDARPLDLTHVNLTPQDRNGMRVLLISAIVENRTDREVALPRVRADLLVGGQIIASTYIEPPVASLEGGQSRGLAARLQHPGGKTPELRLSFEDAGA
ncbi:hypothetical protein ASE36_16935 [Rhizobium sp. Root274]|uniref:hypothetical protein n=1 Tax=unclassified Rhizobium TaxID=2613769 RepID=UPI0007155F5B|nr:MULTISPECIES: hypothetical protein [unclassified Rhizobium]KQW28121.1 hypothetical protein ASC71_16970 [Rhizobium sp. Root1240]KRD28407.1 hypothetical protein ASE36_16935 [Rhizobium sp. Root274]